MLYTHLSFHDNILLYPDTIPDADKDTNGLSKTEIALVVLVIILALSFAASISCIIILKRGQGSAVPGKSDSKKGEYHAEEIEGTEDCCT